MMDYSRLQMDLFDAITFFRAHGKTWEEIASYGFWRKDDETKQHLTAEEIRCWYETEEKKRLP
jgi:hypothetical protein